MTRHDNNIDKEMGDGWVRNDNTSHTTKVALHLTPEGKRKRELKIKTPRQESTWGIIEKMAKDRHQ